MAKRHSNPAFDRVPTKAQVLRAREELAGPAGPGNYKRVEVVAAEIIAALRDCESAALTVCSALRAAQTPADSARAEAALRLGCSAGLSAQIDRLQRIVEGAIAPHAPRLIVRDVPTWAASR